MRLNRLLLWCGTLAVVQLLSPGARAQDAAASSREDAAALFQQGYDAIIAQDWHTAHVLLRRAWDLEQKPEIAGLLGQAERKLCAERKDATFCSLYLEAARHLDFA